MKASVFVFLSEIGNSARVSIEYKPLPQGSGALYKVLSITGEKAAYKGRKFGVGEFTKWYSQQEIDEMISLAAHGEYAKKEQGQALAPSKPKPKLPFKRKLDDGLPL